MTVRVDAAQYNNLSLRPRFRYEINVKQRSSLLHITQKLFKLYFEVCI